MPQNVTISDVALRAGVSTKTVSNVLNKKGRMSEETRLRVIDAIRELGYHVNRSAQTLRSGETRMLGLAVPSFSQPFFGYFSDIMAKYAHSRGYGLTIGTYFDRPGGLQGFIDDTYHLNADGWVFLADRPLENNGALLTQEYPIVLLGDFPSYGKADAVVMPNEAASQTATTWLLTHSCSRVSFVGAPSWTSTMPSSSTFEDYYARINRNQYNSSLRLLGYLKALDAHHCPLDQGLIASGRHIEIQDGEYAMTAILENGKVPDGVVCVNDAVALGAMATLRQHGLSIPADIQLIGFDNTSYAEYAVPPLTSIDPFAWQYAQIAVDRLIARLGGDTSEVRTFTTGYRLVERKTTRSI